MTLDDDLKMAELEAKVSVMDDELTEAYRAIIAIKAREVALVAFAMEWVQGGSLNNNLVRHVIADFEEQHGRED